VRWGVKVGPKPDVKIFDAEVAEEKRENAENAKSADSRA
jgi:hypothetical protein